MPCRHRSVMELRRRFTRELYNVLMYANRLLLFVMVCYKLIAKDATDASKDHGIFKWIYMAIEALFMVADLVVSLELCCLSTFRCIKTICGTLGFEVLLWVMVSSFQAWYSINSAIFFVALLSALELLHIRPTNNHTHDGEPLPEVPFDLSGNGAVEDGLDGDDLV